MKKSKSTTPVVVFIMALLIGAPVSAQVTIGASIEPNKGAFLDLKQRIPDANNTTSDKGLLLPRVILTDPNKLYPMLPSKYPDAENVKHTGLTVYHIDVHGCNAWLPGGIYVWDGTRWNGINVNQPAPAPSGTVDIVVKVDANGNGTSDPDAPCRKILRFLTYNLGANPNMTVKEQMGYTSGGAADPKVFGDLYQWGRKEDGHEKRNSTTTSSKPADPANAGNQFVTGSTDWLSSPINDLWGNGGGLGAQTDTPYPAGANNPCPSGYRVPTQHEWALLGKEGGNSGDISSDNFTTTDGVAGTKPSSGIVWVRVSGGKASTSNASWSSDGAVRGYALYNSADWDGAADGYKNGTDFLSDAGAPDPLLFLSAGGYRHYYVGSMDYTGSYGYYWNSVVSSYGSYYMYVDSSGVYASSNGTGRAYGMSVRCVAE
jgi:hypothetical protein